MSNVLAQFTLVIGNLVIVRRDRLVVNGLIFDDGKVLVVTNEYRPSSVIWAISEKDEITPMRAEEVLCLKQTEKFVFDAALVILGIESPFKK